MKNLMKVNEVHPDHLHPLGDWTVINRGYDANVNIALDVGSKITLRY